MRSFIFLLLGAGGIASGNVASAGTTGCGNNAPVRNWSDAPLHRQWQARADCEHPERPWIVRTMISNTSPKPGISENFLPLNSQTSPPSHIADAVPAKPRQIVKPGSAVRLWSSNSAGRIQISGTAISGGGAGDLIHVHVAGASRQLLGTVRGTGSVEIAGAGTQVQVWGQP